MRLNLREVINMLSDADPNKVVRDGFAHPMSYRGSYDQLAFAPASNVTVGSMLEHAKSALGATFEGYKGGEYTMTERTPCHIAEYGECSMDDEDELTEIRLLAMLGECCPTCGAALAKSRVEAGDE